MKSFLVIFFLSCIGFVYSQPCKQNPYEWLTQSNWFIGPGLAGKFSGGTLTISAFPNSTSYEGTSSASDDKGNLLFLTNGRILWDANGNQKYNKLLEGNEGSMTNGSAAQGIITVRHPLDTTKYYIFTVDDVNNGSTLGLNYFTFDRNGNNLSGPVQLGSYRTTEGITATRHANGVDIWITVLGSGTSNYYSYLLTCNGVKSTPVLSTAPNVSGQTGRGGHSFSWDSKYFAAGYGLGGANNIIVYKFDNQTGIISDPHPIAPSLMTTAPYDILFSPDNTKLYFSTNLGSLGFFDISSWNTTTITATYKDIPGVTTGLYSAIEIGGDGNLYMTSSSTLVKITGNLNTGTLTSSYIPGANTSLGLSTMYIPPSEKPEIQKAGPFCITDKPFDLATKWKCNGMNAEDYIDKTSIYSGKGITDPINGTFDPSVAGAGTHQIIFKRCNVTDTIYITVGPCSISIDVASTPTGCSSPNGTATATVIKGTPQYTFSWSNGQTSSTITGLSAGIYTVSITDGAGLKSTQTVLVTQLNGPTVTVTGTTPSDCKGATGSASASATGGTLAYTYLWNNGQTTSVATGLTEGTYTVKVTDANGCTSIKTAAVPSNNTMSVTATSTPTGCTVNYGTATAITITGTGPFSYVWSNGETASSISGLASGTYSVIITDINGCTRATTVNVIPKNTLSITATATPTGCLNNTGTASTSVLTGVQPCSYIWNNGQTTSSIIGLAPGTYSVVVKDSDGCTKTQSATVTELKPSINISVTASTISPGDSVTLSVKGGNTYEWSPPDGLSCTTCPNPTAKPLKSTTYCVLATDTNGCKDNKCITVNVEIPCETVFVPGAFSPNGDGQNDVICLMGNNCIDKLSFQIFNRWGEKVFEVTDPSANMCWDGTFRGTSLNTAVFVYYLHVTYINGDQLKRKGGISLIR